MKHHRLRLLPVALVAACGALLASCVNIHIDEAAMASLERMADDMNANAVVARDAEAQEGPVRRFLVVRGTVLAEPDPALGPVAEQDDRPQILLESSVVYAPGEGPVQALATATPYDHEGIGKVWLGGLQAPDASFGLHARVIELPTIVTMSADEAKVQVSIHDKQRDRRFSHGVDATPWIENDELWIILRYEFRHLASDDDEEGALVRAVPDVTLRGPAARVWILEIEPAAAVTTEKTEATTR